MAKSTEPEQPPFQGEALYQNIQPNAKASGQLLGPGRWCLHSRSTVPYVKVNAGAVGSRNLTWGEIYEVPAGRFGQVLNASFHAGDIVLAQTGGDTAPPRPARITVKALLANEGTPETTHVATQWVDTRLARRVYLATHPLTFEGDPSSFQYTVIQQAPTQGAPIDPAGVAALQNGSFLQMTRTVIGPLEVWPVGFGSSEYLDTAGNTFPDTRPMSLLDRVRVRVAIADAEEIDFHPGVDSFYIIEY